MKSSESMMQMSKLEKDILDGFSQLTDEQKLEILEIAMHMALGGVA